MNQFTHFPRRLAKGAAIAALAVATLLPGLALADQGEPPPVPANLQVPAGNDVSFSGNAVGIQIYSCQAQGTSFGWTFVAPQATLYDDNGIQEATHYAGPTWQANDGSTVVGTKIASAVVSPTAIPWLLLSAKSTTTGSNGGTTLTYTTYIQRVNTTGGLAPTSGCSSAADVGATANVSYTADYFFYEPD